MLASWSEYSLYMLMKCCCETQAGDSVRPTSERVSMLPLDSSSAGQYDVLNLAKMCRQISLNITFTFCVMLR